MAQRASNCQNPPSTCPGTFGFALTGDTNLKALPEWDSLAALGVIIMFDMEYNKAITGKDLVQCQLVSDVYKLIG